MASDAHAHPFDLAALHPGAETERRALGLSCAASAWNEAEFNFQEGLSRAAAAEGAAPMILCFGAHPQLALADPEAAFRAAALLPALAAEGRIAAVGEIGFDYFDAAYRGTEAVQRRLFEEQLAAARRFGLPAVLHLRHAMHEAFAYAKELAALPAVVFHSYSGTLREARDIVGRGVDAFFSFGTPIRLNHKRAMEACAGIDADRMLFETDAPYQKPRGKEYSTWSDLAETISAAAKLRAAAGTPHAAEEELERAGDENFARAYGVLTSASTESPTLRNFGAMTTRQ